MSQRNDQECIFFLKLHEVGSVLRDKTSARALNKR